VLFRSLPRPLMVYLVFVGLVMAACTLGTIWWATEQYGDVGVGRTMGVVVFSLANIWFALETADPKRSLFSGGILDNPTLLKATGLAILATIVAVEIGLLNRLLGTVSLTVDQWVISVVMSLGVVIAVEGARLLNIRTEEAPTAAVQQAAAA